MPKPLPSRLVLDQFDQERWDACRRVAHLRQAAAEFPNRNVLVRATQRHEIQSMLAFQGVTVPERSIETIDLPSKSLRDTLPAKVARYVRVMDDAVQEVRTAPVGYVLRRVVRSLAGLPEGTRDGSVTNDEADQLFEWMDTSTELTSLTKLSLGVFELRRLDPFDNTADLLPIYITLELVKSDDLQAQILPVAVHLDQNQARFDQVYRETEVTENFNNLVRFFADGLAEQAGHQLHLIQELAELPDRYDEKYRSTSEAKDRRDGFSHMLTVLPQFQIVTSELIAKACGFSPKSAREYLLKAEKLEFVKHVDTRRQVKIYEVMGVRHAIDTYAGKARHRGRADLPRG